MFIACGSGRNMHFVVSPIVAVYVESMYVHFLTKLEHNSTRPTEAGVVGDLCDGWSERYASGLQQDGSTLFRHHVGCAQSNGFDDAWDHRRS